MNLKKLTQVSLVLCMTLSCGMAIAMKEQAQQQSNRGDLFKQLEEKQAALFKKIHSIAQEQRFSADVDPNAGMKAILYALEGLSSLKNAIISTQEYKNYKNDFLKVNDAIVRDETTGEYFEGNSFPKTLPQPDPILNLTPAHSDSIFKIFEFALFIKAMVCDNQIYNIELLYRVGDLDRHEGHHTYSPIYLKEHNVSQQYVDAHYKEANEAYRKWLLGLAKHQQLKFSDDFWKKRGEILEKARSNK